MRELLFSSDYGKLGKNRFTTIRQHGRDLSVNSLCKVKSPDYQFIARVIERFGCSLGMISDKLLLEDTDTSSREEAFKVLGNCWDKQVDNETRVIFLKLARTRDNPYIN